MVEGRKAGFTLLEAMVALTLSSVIVALVSSVFLTQNNFYRSIVQRTRVQDNLRVVTDFISSEVRAVADGGVTTAESRRLVVRLPILMGGICSTSALGARMFMPGYSDLDTNEVAGFATKDASGAWTYTPDVWSNLYVGAGPAHASVCVADSGADTAGVSQEFVRMYTLGNDSIGDVVMLYREVEFKIDQSDLEPRSLAVYRGVTGDSLRELATGITSDAKFQYRLPGGSYQNSISGGQLTQIENIRVVAAAIATDSLGTLRSYSYEWTVDIPLRNRN